MEAGLVRQLQAQLTIAPPGPYRTGIERHLEETRGHAERVRERLKELGPSSNPLLTGLGAAETFASQFLAMAKAPLDAVRGMGKEDRLLKNARDCAAAEAMEIATYTAIESLARAAGDEPTAELAVAIRADEERMLALVMKELPGLAASVAGGGGAASGGEPWPGYDAENVSAVKAGLAGADAATARAVRDYERRHKKRAGVLDAAERRAAEG